MSRMNLFGQSEDKVSVLTRTEVSNQIRDRVRKIISDFRDMHDHTTEDEDLSGNWIEVSHKSLFIPTLGGWQISKECFPPIITKLLFPEKLVQVLENSELYDSYNILRFLEETEDSNDIECLLGMLDHFIQQDLYTEILFNEFVKESSIFSNLYSKEDRDILKHFYLTRTKRVVVCGTHKDIYLDFDEFPKIEQQDFVEYEDKNKRRIKEQVVEFKRVVFTSGRVTAISQKYSDTRLTQNMLKDLYISNRKLLPLLSDVGYGVEKGTGVIRVHPLVMLHLKNTDKDLASLQDINPEDITLNNLCIQLNLTKEYLLGFYAGLKIHATNIEEYWKKDNIERYNGVQDGVLFKDYTDKKLKLYSRPELESGVIFNLLRVF